MRQIQTAAPDTVTESAAQFKYDVAFSFLSADEPLALQLNDLLSGRVRTFIYTEQQKKVAGTDGEVTFNRVFRHEARLVVVLYRDGWGETPWTRIEQTAIRERAYDHGYDFAKFIPVEDKTTLPPWLPRTQLYIGLKRWGADGAAAVIEERIRELGGQPHQETIEEHAQRVQRKLEFEKRREKFQWDAGANEARASAAKLLQLVRRVAESISQSSAIRLNVLDEGSLIGPVTWLQGLGRPMSIIWRMRAINHLRDAELSATILTHLPSGPGRIVWEQPSTVKRWDFAYDLLPTDVGGWVAKDGRPCTFSNEQLAEYIVKLYLEHAPE